MPNINIKCQESEVEIDRDLLQKFSDLARKDNSITEISVDASKTQIEFIKEYCEHHSKKEATVPAGVVQVSWTLETVFDDSWDGEFLKRVVEHEKDKYLIKFSEIVEHFDMDTLLKKVALSICIVIVAAAGSTMKPEKLADEFNKMALKEDRLAK